MQDAERLNLNLNTIKDYEKKMVDLEREFKEKAVLNKEAEKALELMNEFKDSFEENNAQLIEKMTKLKKEIEEIKEVGDGIEEENNLVKKDEPTA